MKPKRFISNSLPKLFVRVRRELGDDAVILGTRTLHREGGPPLIELLAAAAEPTAAPLPLPLQGVLTEGALAAAEGRSALEILDAEPAREGFAVVRSGSEAALPDAETPFQPAAPALALSPLEATLAEIGLSDDAAARIVSESNPNADPRGALARSLVRPVAYPADGETTIVTIQGPTSAGRTAALVRMALDCTEAGREAILVAADPTKAAGRDQIHAYASALGLQAVDATDGAVIDLVAYRANAGACLFVDVPAGPWQPDPWPQTRQIGYLLLPANWEQSALRRALRSYATENFSGFVISFVDLATSLSGVLSLVVESGLGIAFLCAGRDVSSGITPADPAALASGLMDANTGERTDGRVSVVA